MTRLDELMAELCYDREITTVDGDVPSALGNRIAAVILADTSTTDRTRRAATSRWTTRRSTRRSSSTASGTTMNDPNRWQPLELEEMVAQNGLPLDETVQTFVGPHWGDGHVVRAAATRTPTD